MARTGRRENVRVWHKAAHIGRERITEIRYALWGFDDRNRPVARENLTIQEVRDLREEKGLRTYHINPMQGDPPPKPPANRSFVRLDGGYKQVPLGVWVYETYHFSDIEPRPLER